MSDRRPQRERPYSIYTRMWPVAAPKPFHKRGHCWQCDQPLHWRAARRFGEARLHAYCVGDYIHSHEVRNAGS